MSSCPPQEDRRANDPQSRSLWPGSKWSRFLLLDPKMPRDAKGWLQKRSCSRDYGPVTNMFFWVRIWWDFWRNNTGYDRSLLWQNDILHGKFAWNRIKEEHKSIPISVGNSRRPVSPRCPSPCLQWFRSSCRAWTAPAPSVSYLGLDEICSWIEKQFFIGPSPKIPFYIEKPNASNASKAVVNHPQMYHKYRKWLP